ncbi:ChaN family lipoprotein, partial [Aeromonas hydrophila]|uniref:ChaN family lipoprotein n=1 Tax=Aeromonas hydrophila TaxID=644 RepID=UPI0036DDECE3
ACTTSQPLVSTPLATLDKHQTGNPQQEALTLEQTTTRLAEADIILVGELHTHPAIHLLQSRLLSALYQQAEQNGRGLTLSME